LASLAPPVSAPVDQVTSLYQRWYVLIIMMLVYTVSIADRYVLSTVLGPISRELHLSDKGAASLGIPLALFYVTMGIPLSWLADRSSRRNILVGAVAMWSVMTTLCGFTRGYWDLLLARIGVGVGEAAGTPACNAIIADYFPADRRCMATTIFALGAPIGAWLGADIAGAISAAHGWRAAFMVLGIPGIILAATILLTTKEPRRGRLDLVEEGEAPSLSETLRFLWSQKAAVHVMAGSAVSAFWGWGLMWFTPLFFQRSYGMNEGVSGAFLGQISLWGGIAASLVTAWIVGRPAYTDPRKITRLLAVVTAIATVPSFLGYWTHDLAVARAMMWIFIPGIYFYVGPTFALCQNLAPCRMRSMFVAITLLVCNVMNLIVAPALVGTLSDYFAGAHGADAASLRLAQMVLAPSGLWAAYHYWAAGKNIVEDQRRAVGYV
jgi:predicted MFS family arabinose efflux permease